MLCTSSNPPLALLPCSFRLACGGHLLDIAAACQREKDLWISAIHESFKHRPSWINQPVSSLHGDGDGGFDAARARSPTSSRGHDGQTCDPAAPAPAVRVDVCMAKRPDGSHVSRRSSTASVKAIFAASDTTILIRRASPTARYTVEAGLLDVFSDLCLTARLRAGTQDEELFQAPKTVRGGFSRSSSGLVMTGMGVAAKNRLTKRESVLVPRRTGGSDGHGHMDVEAQQLGVSKPKSLSSRRHGKKLKLASPALRITVEGEVGGMSDSPPALSPCSSQTGSNAGSTSNSPTETMPGRSHPLQTSTNIPRPDLLTVQESGYHRRSMVEGMKDLFKSRSLSPASSASGHHSLPPPSPQDACPTPNTITNYSIFRRFSSSLRRRARSEPNAPDEEPLQKLFSASAAAQESVKSNAVRRNKTTKERSLTFLSTTDDGQLQGYSDPVGGSTSDLHRPTPIRRRSLFTSAPSRRQMMASTGDEPVPKRPITHLQRNKSFLHRFSPLNNATTAPSLVNAAQ